MKKKRFKMMIGMMIIMVIVVGVLAISQSRDGARNHLKPLSRRLSRSQMERFG